jgi:hypothetical protein
VQEEVLHKRLLADDDAYRRQLMTPGMIDKVNGRKTSDADCWQDVVKATIAWAGWAKREMRTERNRRKRRNIQHGGREGPDDDIAHRIETVCWVDARIRFAGEDKDNCSSKECYSLSSSSDLGKRGLGRLGDDYVNNNIDNDDDRFARRLIRKGPHCAKLKSGKLVKELLWKDPLFQQEREDEDTSRELLRQILRRVGL